MILLGAAAGIGFMIITNSFYNEFKVKDYNSEFNDLDSGSGAQ
jgi:hypothetical protein